MNKALYALLDDALINDEWEKKTASGYDHNEELTIDPIALLIYKTQ